MWALVAANAGAQEGQGDGAGPLGPEHSHSFTLGLAARPFTGFRLTLDYYRIRLDDRIVMSSEFTVDPGQAARLFYAQLGITFF